jgi:hypothetical protein
MNIKQRAIEIYNQHISLATTDGRLFRKTVMDQLVAETGCSIAGAATHYNNCKKTIPVEGLGRPVTPKGVRKVSTAKGKQSKTTPDSQCFTVMEITKEGKVGRSESFEFQGVASELFDGKVKTWPNKDWVMINGLGPNPGDEFKLSFEEKEIKSHRNLQVDTVAVA